MTVWDRFDYKAVVCFTGYKDRYILLQKELDRVGLTDVHPHWDFPNPYNKVLMSTVPMTKFNRNRGCFNIGMNNYRAIATAYHLGCKNCFVMEDDVRFLKDISLIEEILESIPANYDLVLLDNNKPCSIHEEEYLEIFRRKISTHWCRFSNLRSTGCYLMSRRCMSRYIKLFEDPVYLRGVLRNPDGYFMTNYLGEDMNLYVSTPPLALQKTFSTTHCSSKRMDEYYSLREKTGIQITEYSDF